MHQYWPYCKQQFKSIQNMEQLGSKYLPKPNQSWMENELDKINSASQLKDPAKTSKPLPPDTSNANISLSLGKTATSYPHIPQKLVFFCLFMQQNPKELSNRELEELLRTGKLGTSIESPLEQPSIKSFKPLSSYGTAPEPEAAHYQRKIFPAATEPEVPKPADLLAKYATPNKPIVTASSNLQYSASKAYTSAMKALQDRVRQLERENEHLTGKLKNVEKTLEDEQGRLQTRIMEEMNHWGEVEKKLQRDLKTAENESITLRQELTEVMQAKEFLARQVQQLEKEKERHLEQNSIERDQWRKEKNQLLNQISESNEKVQQLLNQKEVMLDEIEETKEKLTDIEGLLEKSRKDAEGDMRKLKSENHEMREKLRNIQKNHDQEMVDLKEELQDAYKEIQRLKQKSKEDAVRERNNTTSFKRTIENQKKEIELLKSRQSKYTQVRPATRPVADKRPIAKKPEATQRSTSKGTSATERNKKPEVKTPKSRSGSKEIKKVPSRSKSKKKHNLSISRSKDYDTLPEKEEKNQFKEKANRTLAPLEAVSLAHPDTLSQFSSDYAFSTKARGGLEEVSNEIFFLEREIADLNRQYKELLAKSQDASNEKLAANLRIDLNHIARLLEEKSESLFELKKQQQLALKVSQFVYPFLFFLYDSKWI
eukprot:TRINITY_DN234_c0_g1_i1.p2 TRINITY_DN234_c0_g1~~TRINITY_DN234_c0_g1_i1.p2  ORF type:complete len:655 (-),score=114.19 TRINITY_DN234_c0_g1_i1:17194-19158(-)